MLNLILKYVTCCMGVGSEQAHIENSAEFMMGRLRSSEMPFSGGLCGMFVDCLVHRSAKWLPVGICIIVHCTSGNAVKYYRYGCGCVSSWFGYSWGPGN